MDKMTHSCKEELLAKALVGVLVKARVIPAPAAPIAVKEILDAADTYCGVPAGEYIVVELIEDKSGGD